MSNPSPKSHLYRLGAVLILFAVGFLTVKSWATPDSWDYEHWYRGDALKDNAALPIIYGGNDSCQTCHESVNEELAEYRHKTLSCESCHGALADHVRMDKKFADAKVDRSRWQCQNCHAERINRPSDLPQFSKTGEIGKEVKKHQKLDDKTPCLKCHEAHDPAAA